jgi:hypothetical protein
MRIELIVEFRDIGPIDASHFKIMNDITIDVNGNALLLHFLHGYYPVIIRLVIISFKVHVRRPTYVGALIHSFHNTRINASMN